MVNYYSLSQKNSKNAKILKIEQSLDMPISDQTPLFKFGFNPSLIDGILNVLPYELAS